MSNVPQDEQQALLDLAREAGFIVRNGTLDACGNGVLETLDRLLKLRDQRSNAEPVDWKPLQENANERRMFDEAVELWGDVRKTIAITLRTWASTNDGGSYAEQCRIMANEVAKLYTAPPDYAAGVAAGMMKAAEIAKNYRQRAGGSDFKTTQQRIELAILSAIPDDSKAALREVCMKVAIEAEQEGWHRGVSGMTPDLESIVDSVLEGKS